jgi:hypothetical protein
MELHETKAEVYETWNTITNDLWAKINSKIMAEVGRREADDRNHYGKMRATIERRTRGRK